jgi:pyridinium-3,5-biscarboxylic acid mononucleotide synthase
LASMLQTCTMGMTVVNIDNGIGAGSFAAMVANKMSAVDMTKSI